MKYVSGFKLDLINCHRDLIQLNSCECSSMWKLCSEGPIFILKTLLLFCLLIFTYTHDTTSWNFKTSSIYHSYFAVEFFSINVKHMEKLNSYHRYHRTFINLQEKSLVLLALTEYLIVSLRVFTPKCIALDSSCPSINVNSWYYCIQRLQKKSVICWKWGKSPMMVKM